MAKNVLVLSHEVKNFDEWKTGFDSDAGRREANGFKLLGLYRAEDNPNVVTMITEVADVNMAKAMFNDEGLKASMAAAGVISEPVAQFLQEVE